MPPAAKIAAEDPEKTLTVYIRKENGGAKVVGIDRTWPRGFAKTEKSKKK